MTRKQKVGYWVMLILLLVTSFGAIGYPLDDNLLKQNDSHSFAIAAVDALPRMEGGCSSTGGSCTGSN